MRRCRANPCGTYERSTFLAACADVFPADDGRVRRVRGRAAAATLSGAARRRPRLTVSPASTRGRSSIRCSSSLRPSRSLSAKRSLARRRRTVLTRAVCTATPAAAKAARQRRQQARPVAPGDRARRVPRAARRCRTCTSTSGSARRRHARVERLLDRGRHVLARSGATAAAHEERVEHGAVGPRGDGGRVDVEPAAGERARSRRASSPSASRQATSTIHGPACPSGLTPTRAAPGRGSGSTRRAWRASSSGSWASR